MRYVIVGASAAGLAAAEAVAAMDPGATRTLVSEEPHPPYSRPLLSYWLAGDVSREQLPLPSQVLDQTELHLGVRALALDPQRRRLTLADGRSLTYDRLCLATGAHPKRLGLAGEELTNVFPLRTWADAEGIAAQLSAGAERAVVLGGGLVGVKAAEALRRRGLEVTVCVASEFPLSQTVDATAGGVVVDALREAGIGVRLGAAPTALVRRGDRVTGVCLRGAAETLPCDLVVCGKGVAPAGELAAGAGVDAAAGVPVNRALESPLPQVWAAGDVARAADVAWGELRVNAIWPVAVELGTLAGRNMAGAGESYRGGVAMNCLRLGTAFVVSAGITRPTGTDCDVFTQWDPVRRRYRKIVVRAGRVAGAIVVGDAEQAGLLVSAVRQGLRPAELPFDPLGERLHWGRVAFPSLGLGS